VLFYIDGENAEWTAARNKRHHHEPTVEDVLREFAAKLIERGELTNGGAQTIAEYAAKLRLAGDAE
jgi:predicted Ser/Thr protein kinase